MYQFYLRLAAKLWRNVRNFRQPDNRLVVNLRHGAINRMALCLIVTPIHPPIRRGGLANRDICLTHNNLIALGYR